MNVALGAPVGDDRAEFLPHYHTAIHLQTVRPQHLCFVRSAGPGGVREGLQGMYGAELHVRETRVPFADRAQRTADPGDPNRAQQFAKFRNELRTLFLATDADVFVSCDTDVLLTDPRTIERLVHAVTEGGWDVAAPRLCLHPGGEASQCYNAGWFAVDAAPGDEYHQPWQRATASDLALRHAPARIDIPMACYAIRRHALALCHYRAHESGEDIGFAQSLRQHRMRVGWLHDIWAEHVWGPHHLDEALAKAPWRDVA